MTRASRHHRTTLSGPGAGLLTAAAAIASAAMISPPASGGGFPDRPGEHAQRLAGSYEAAGTRHQPLLRTLDRLWPLTSAPYDDRLTEQPLFDPSFALDLRRRDELLARPLLAPASGEAAAAPTSVR